jgi:hypothetical protein
MDADEGTPVLEQARACAFGPDDSMANGGIPHPSKRRLSQAVLDGQFTVKEAFFDLAAPHYTGSVPQATSLRDTAGETTFLLWFRPY